MCTNSLSVRVVYISPMTTSSKAASGGGNGDIKRIANQLLDASKQAKDRLTQQQEGYLAWLCEELMRVKGRFMQPPSSVRRTYTLVAMYHLPKALSTS
jgi:hypothetical protein